MQLKFTCLLLLAGVLAASCISVDESIKKKLPNNVASSLDRLESLSSRDLSFPSVFEAREFVRACNEIRHELAEVDEQAWDGAAKELLKAIEDPKIIEICNIPEATFDSFEDLDDRDTENLSPGTVYKIKGLRIIMEQEKILGVMFSKLVDQKLSRMSLKVLNYAVPDTLLFFGEKKFGWTGETTLSGCQLKEVSKICDIAGSASPRAEVNGDDFAHLTEIIKSNEGLKSSDLEQLKNSCKSVNPNLLLFKYINMYQKAELLKDSYIKMMCEANTEFNFYYQLKKLCDSCLE